jgi:predicted GNAT superfamily acetyltransferase
VLIRDLTDGDVEAVLRLNEESVDALAPLDQARLDWLRSMTGHALVCAVDGQVVGFALAFPPRTSYDSVNYGWHAERFDDFLYLDRIAVDGAWRRRGIASLLYDEMELRATRHGRMVCEVNSLPANIPSLVFHRARGYREIGHIRHREDYEVVMLEKPL